jgi:hypothetical protein
MEVERASSPEVGAFRARPRLSAQGVAVLQTALERTVASRNPTSVAGLQHAIRRICLDARRNAWPPEQLLVAFKKALHSLPCVQRLTAGPDRDELVARLVTLCIEEYYGAAEPIQMKRRLVREYRELLEV